MTRSPKWILLAIDGTNSEELKKEGESHTRKFHRLFGRNLRKENCQKFFIEGPNLSGSNCMAKYLSGYFQIISSIIGLLGKDIPLRVSGHDFIRVVLIGHSRGGAMVMAISKMLMDFGVRVYFMGIFDAVDRSDQLTVSTIVNSRFVYHAVRADLPFGRKIMGHTGEHCLGAEKYRKRVFFTSHGGTNGQVDLSPKMEIVDDCSCGTPPLPVETWYGYRVESKTEAKLRSDRCVLESAKVYSWMVNHSRVHGLPI